MDSDPSWKSGYHRDISCMVSDGALGEIRARLARLARLSASSSALERQQSEGDVNFGFQAACREGRLDAAELLLAPCSIISVSRGLRRAVEASRIDCARLAAGRLVAEGALDQYDLALALRDARMDRLGGRECAELVLGLAEPWAASWAMRELMAADKWGDALGLLRAGAAWAEPPELPMLSRVGWALAEGIAPEASAWELWSMGRDRGAWDAREREALAAGKPAGPMERERAARLAAFAAEAERWDLGESASEGAAGGRRPRARI